MKPMESVFKLMAYQFFKNIFLKFQLFSRRIVKTCPADILIMA